MATELQRYKAVLGPTLCYASSKKLGPVAGAVQMVRMLVIDSDRACLHALAQRLRFVFGHRTLWVDVTDYSAEALILAGAHHYDVLIVDVPMPGGKGVKFIEQLARLQPGVPIILMGSTEREGWEAEVRRLGLTAFLPKPIDFHTLVQGLTSVLSAQAGLRRHKKLNTLRKTYDRRGPRLPPSSVKLPTERQTQP